MNRLGIEAKFTGAGSAGFEAGRRYALWLSLTNNPKAPVQIHTQNGQLACPYGSLKAFLANWDVLQ